MQIDKQILEKLGITKTNSDVPKTLHERIEQEKKLELEMIRSGINRFHKTINKTKEKLNKDGHPRETSESVTIYGQQLAQSGLEPMCIAINEYFMKAFDGHATKYASEAIILSKCIPTKDIDIESNHPSYLDRWSAISFITLKSVLDSITIGSTQAKAIIKISSSIEDEARGLYFKERDSKTYTQTVDWLKSKNNYRHKRKVFMYAMNKHELEFKGFDKEDKIKLGKLLLEFLVKYTGFVQLINKVKGNKMYKHVEATAKTLEWIENKKFHSEILKPFKLPMIIRPKRWVNPYSGGYYIKELRPQELKHAL